MRPPRFGKDRATVVGAGSFGTAVAVLLVRAGLRTTLLCRTPEQAAKLEAAHENAEYLPGVPLPERLKIRVLSGVEDQFDRADLVFVAVPSAGLAQALVELQSQGVPRRAGIVSLTKGLVPPDGTPPTTALERAFGIERVACIGGPAHAMEMVESGAGLVCASHSPSLAERVADVFHQAGVVCQPSDDPVGVELAGCAKNAAALAAGATEPLGLNAAGMAAADIFTEVLALAQQRGARRPAPLAGRTGRRDTGPDWSGGRGVRDGPAARARDRAGGHPRADHVRTRAPDRRDAAAVGLGRSRARVAA
jgi:glycerol-3-phosphate dehydrogenase (NAD(P)+)